MSIFILQMRSSRQRKVKWPKVTQLLPLWQKTLVIVYKSDSLPVQEGLQMQAGLPTWVPGVSWASVQGMFVQQRLHPGPQNKQSSRNPYRSAAMPEMPVT